MGVLENLVFVFVAGLLTAFATGLGAVPFFFVDEFSDRWRVALWGLAGGIMVSASVFGLVTEGLAAATGRWQLAVGLLAGVVLVVVADAVLDHVDIGGDGHDHDDSHHHGAGDDDDHDHSDDQAHEVTRPSPDGGRGHTDGHTHADGHGHDHHVDPQAIVEGDLKKLVLILGVLTVHSFPEGVAVGVSFAELGFEGGIPVLGLTVPVLAVFMTVAISIHNVPEGLAISIPLQELGVSRWRMVGAAVFSSLPQPIGAVIAFYFVRIAREFLPIGFGFAAGAMIFLVLTEFIPEALSVGRELPGRGYRELAVGLTVGVLGMVPLAFV
ncbi:ZIP family metal transporter [Halobium salinum]|uniref:ZIP family metal transporter n=1 Tax=Halobium salinum TaxID=1364940 RepID=A0ABD5PGT3_9EURY|nr:ZIP family metal transporter [Halobium salinum]